MTITQHRVPKGISTGGQFAPDARSEAAVTITASEAFGPDFERTHGRATASAVLRQPKVAYPEALQAGKNVDGLRESYDEYFAYGKAERSRADAVASLRSDLCNLDRGRQDHWLQQIGYAVHVEMKHREDREFVLHPDNNWEVVIDPSDFGDEDDLVDNGNRANADEWELAANTAMAHALRENAAAAALPAAA